MKKFLLSLAAVMTCFFGYADEAHYTITFKTGSKTMGSVSSLSDLIDTGIDYVSTFKDDKNVIPQTADGVSIGSNNNAGSLTLVLSDNGKKTAKRIVLVDVKSKSGTISMDVNNIGEQNATTTVENLTYSYDVATEISEITINASKKSYLKSIEVYYDDNSGSDTPTEPIAYEPNFQDVSLTVGETYNVNLGDKHPSSMILVSGNDDIATITDDGIITAVGVGTTTITCSWDADENFKAPEKDLTFDVMVKGTVDPSDATQAYFYSPSVTANIPDYGTKLVNGSGVSGGNNNTAKTALCAVEGGFNSNAVNLTFSSTDGSNFAYINKDNKISIYKGNTFTFSVPLGFEISEITFNATNDKLSADCGSFVNGTWTTKNGESNSSVKFTYASNASSNWTSNCISEIKVKYNPIEKTDFAWEGISSSSEGVFVEDYDIWMPENTPEATVSVILPTGFKGDSKNFNWELVWNEESSNPLSYNIENGNMVLKSTETGIFQYSLSIIGSVYYKDSDAFVGKKNIYVYPHVNDHFNYDDTELSLCLDQETGIFKLTKYEETCTEGYKYFYKVDNNASVTRAAADEGYTEYNHETGITLEEGRHTLEFVAEKNGVRSYQPKIFSISVSTGVEAIGAEAGEAVYFDLQGRRVNGQPEQGLYIVRKGGKTSKVVL